MPHFNYKCPCGNIFEKFSMLPMNVEAAMSRCPKCKRLAKWTMLMTIQQKQFQMRGQRMIRLLSFRAPRVIIEQEALLLLSTYGLAKPLWHRYSIKVKSWFSYQWLRLWHKGVLRKTDKQIEKELFGEYDEPETSVPS